nr:hypothetical protein [Paenibacillus xylanexedens]
MSNGNKVVIPAVVADALDQAKKERMGNESILEVRNEEYPGETQVNGAALRFIPFNTLLRSLVNGYESELTEEQKRADRERELARDYEQHRNGAGRYDEYSQDYAFADGIEYALDMIGVKIGGVNA